MTISTIVAVSENGVIGKDNATPWYLPAELVRFKQITMGHPIIMGRKTHESIGRALPGRQNIVITRDKNYRAEGCEIANSVEEALEIAKDNNEVFIIGGATIYEQVMPLLNKVYLTRVRVSIEGDKFFELDEKQWNKVASEDHPADEKNKYAFEFQEWVRRAK